MRVPGGSSECLVVGFGCCCNILMLVWVMLEAKSPQHVNSPYITSVSGIATEYFILFSIFILVFLSDLILRLLFVHTCVFHVDSTFSPTSLFFFRLVCGRLFLRRNAGDSFLFLLSSPALGPAYMHREVRMRPMITISPLGFSSATSPVGSHPSRSIERLSSPISLSVE